MDQVPASSVSETIQRSKNSEEFVEDLIEKKLEKKKGAKKEEEKEKKEEPMLRRGRRRKEEEEPMLRRGRRRKEEEEPLLEEQMLCATAESVHSVEVAALAGEGRMNLIGEELTKVKMFEDEVEVEMEVKEEEEEEDKEEEGYKDYGKYETLRRAAVDEDWHVVKEFIEDDPEALTAKLLDSSETILHYVVKSENIIEFVQELVSKMPEEALELTDMRKMTALSYCAAYGNTEAAKIMVKKNHKLLNIPDKWGNLPLHHAARFGHKDTVDFLLREALVDDPSPFTGESGVRLVENLITANLYGIALELLKDNTMLAREKLEDRKRVLETLAQKPLGFASGSQLGFWQRLIYNCIPDDLSLSDVRGGDEENPKKSSKDCFTKCREFGFLQRTSSTFGAMCKKVHIMLYNTIKRLVPSIKSIHDTKLMHKHTSELIKLICKGVTLNFEEAKDSLKMPILTAARLGIQEIVYEIMKTYFPSTFFVDDDKRNIFQLAVLHRQEKVFSLIYKMGLEKDWVASFRDKSGNKSFRDNFGNNILHLAGKLVVPSSRVSGAALQMQRELQWYKVVEKKFHPSLREEENDEKLTPREVFTKEHAELVKAGEEWIKNAATSCSVVAALIITVAFAAAITVPGGNDSQGNPIYLKTMSFSIFAISNALALCFSSASVLMFLGILTSRYSEEDFLFSLPRKIIIGLFTLFLSIVAMMIAFGETLYLLVFHPQKWNNSPLVLLACLPVTLFGLLQIRLLVEMLRSTYGPSFIQPPK